MNSSWHERLRARLATPQPLFLDADGAARFAALPGGTAVDVIVSARLLHELVCEPGLPLDSEPALQAYARQLFGHYFGAPAQRWPLATWRAAEQKGATALHGLDWTALAQAAEAAAVFVRRVQPAWAPLLQRLAVEETDWLRAPTAALAWVEGQVLTWLVLEGGQLLRLRQLRLPTATQAAVGEALGEALAELREGASVLVLGYGLDAGATPVWPGVRVLSRLDGTAPELAWFAQPAEASAALPQADFLGPRVVRARLAWPLALVGGLALILACGGLWASHQGLTEAQRRLALIGDAKPVKATAVAARPGAAQAQDTRTASEVQALLQQAWEPLLANVEQAGLQTAPGQLSWLGLDYSAGRNELRLEGLTQDKLAALQLVDRLSAAPGWQGVVLSRFQTGEQGLTGQRFDLSARLVPALLKLELSPAFVKERP